jgi:hypothetical protein
VNWQADFASEQHHAVVAGDIDMCCIAEVLAQALSGAQFNAFIF